MRSKEESSGLFFVAFMFLGMGIGYVLGNTAGGLFIGMGIGFFAMAYMRMKAPIKGESESQVREMRSRSEKLWGSAMLTLIGIGFILGGTSFILGWKIAWDKLGGIFLILLGLAFLGMALERIR